MPPKFNSTSLWALSIRYMIGIGKGERSLTPVISNDIPGLSMHYFDMTLNDGRVYRVRVSDITPEGE